MINNTILWAAAWAETARGRVATALAEERGQGIMEYGILAGAVAIIAAVLFTAVGPGGTIGGAFTTFTQKVGGCLKFDNTCK